MSNDKGQLGESKKVASASDPDLAERVKQVLEGAQQQRSLKQQEKVVKKARHNREEFLWLVLAMIVVFALSAFFRYLGWR